MTVNFFLKILGKWSYGGKSDREGGHFLPNTLYLIFFKATHFLAFDQSFMKEQMIQFFRFFMILKSPFAIFAKFAPLFGQLEC